MTSGSSSRCAAVSTTLLEWKLIKKEKSCAYLGESICLDERRKWFSSNLQREIAKPVNIFCYPGMSPALLHFKVVSLLFNHFSVKKI